MIQNITKKRATALANKGYIREDTKEDLFIKMHYYFVYKRLECVDLQMRKRKQKYDQQKRRYNNHRINSQLFKKIL